MIEDDFEAKSRLVWMAAYELMLTKHHDYGPKNIALAPGGALNGLIVRMHDKKARYENLIATGRTAKNESLRDTFVDMANYALIAVMVLDGDWPMVE